MRPIRGLVLPLGMLAASLAIAQSTGGQFDVTDSVIAPAQTVSGGAFSMTGTVGQPSAATTAAGSFELVSGFATPVVTDRIFANGFEP